MENNSLLRTDKELAELYQRHVDHVYRLSYIYLKNPVDAEDAVQSVFLKLIKSQMVFNDPEHEKAWLMVTTRNYCKDILKNWWKTRRVGIDAIPEISSWNSEEPSGKALAKLLSLPEKYKIVLYLYYIEEYSVKEISEMLGHKESTIQTQLSRGRERLKIDLGGNYHE
ncbi:RNA polymerase sigma factor [Paenibacillus sp. alder61]|uniref:RNA polymerase sigma factor n=1 Tax=Paenibacillus faecis TaxID=862114 RepID=A0A5D0D487_9BACL|nr:MULTISPECIES: RNA polymerase sigma factor [Paenibacillus]MCA1293809.1 RNA polymerase sigma factor [Paenibacillus sp. alder61]TYA15395.1 RNA polymerase sigma factor [Paenibacillus faecis]